MDDLKKIIRALAISKAANGITIAQLNKDFKDLEGYAIPYAKYGFQSLDRMLREMTDAVQVNGFGQTAIVQPLVNEKTQHIREMVKRSKPDRKKSSNNNRYYASQANYRNNFNHTYYSSHLSSDDNGFDDDISYANTIITNGTNDNVQKQQQNFYNGHREEEPQTNNSVHTSTISLHDVNSDRQKKLAKIMKRIATVKPTNGMTIVPDSSKTMIEAMNESIDSSTNELLVPEDAMTRKQKIIDTLPGHLQPKTTVKVVITSVLNPSHMYVHLLEHTTELRRLAPLIDSVYNTKAIGYEWLIPDTMVQNGMYCAAKYHNRWYRAQVMGPVNFQRVLLSYIDYGYRRYVPLADIRFLKKELVALPRQTVRVALKHVIPVDGTWRKECSEQLARMVHRKVFDMTVINVDQTENVLNVILTDSTNCTSVKNVSDESSLNGQLAKRSDIVWSEN